MAQKVIHQWIDDLDDTITEDVRTVSLSLDGKPYEIDLGAANRGKLHAVLAPYIDKGRKATDKPAGKASTVKRGAGTGPGANYTPAQRKEIREWAISNGGRVGDRGRLPIEVYQAWEDSKNVSKLPKSEVLASA